MLDMHSFVKGRPFRVRMIIEVSGDVSGGYLLLFNFFSSYLAALIKAIVNKGLDVIKMIKTTNQRYLLDTKWSKELYQGLKFMRKD